MSPLVAQMYVYLSVWISICACLPVRLFVCLYYHFVCLLNLISMDPGNHLISVFLLAIGAIKLSGSTQDIVII